MQVISTNIGQATAVQWRGKTVQTGIFKYPTESAISLEREGVANDTIANRKVHGGITKACYLFSAHHYPYWKSKYPHLTWNWGMFGENITMDQLDETTLRIGSIYKLGKAVVQITEPRQPCFKLGIRFESQKVIKEFVTHGSSGTYVAVLKEGEVQTGDAMILQEEAQNPLTVKQLYQLLLLPQKDKTLLKLAVDNPFIKDSKREKLEKYL